VNYGIEDEFTFYSIGYGEYRSSVMADYPHNYKFTGLDVGVSTTIHVTERTTYDLLSTFGDVGGINEVLRLIITQLVTGFAYITGTSILAKSLYKEQNFKPLTATEKLERVKLEGNYENIPIPTYLELRYCYYRICCCFRKEKFTRYWNTLAVVDSDLSENMDLVNTLRRIRMHGFALTVMLNKNYRNFTATRSKRKALESLSSDKKKINGGNWNDCE